MSVIAVSSLAAKGAAGQKGGDSPPQPGFMNFGGALPDVHIFKFNGEGQVYWINAVFGGRVQGPVWPAAK